MIPTFLLMALNLIFSIAAVHPRVRSRLHTSLLVPGNMSNLESRRARGNVMFENTRKPKLMLSTSFLESHRNKGPPIFNATQIVEDSLSWIVGEMKHFIKETYFDSERFEVSSRRIRKDIDDLEWKSQDIIFGNSIISRHLHFVKSLFRSMEISAITLKKLNLDSNKETLIIYEIIHTNIRIWGLFNDYGNPDEEVSGYGRNVFEFTRTLICCRKEFDSFHKNARRRLKSIFNDLLKEAEKNVSQLSRHLVHGQFSSAFISVRCDWE